MRAEIENAAASTEALTEVRARFFRGLANPARLRVLATLLEGERNVGEIVRTVEMPQAQVSNALACLRWCGFVKSRQEGRTVYYSLASDGVRDILRLADGILADNVAELYSCVVLRSEEGEASS